MGIPQSPLGAGYLGSAIGSGAELRRSIEQRDEYARQMLALLGMLPNRGAPKPDVPDPSIILLTEGESE